MMIIKGILKTVTIITTIMIVTSCNNQTNKSFSYGLLFCKPGMFEITSSIDHWEKKQSGIWKGEFAHLSVNASVNNIPQAQTIHGFSLYEDQNGNKRLQAMICPAKQKKYEKIVVYLTSQVKPGQLSLYIKDKITQDNFFMPIEKKHLLIGNIHPKNMDISYKKNTNEFFLTLLFENLPAPKKIYPQQNIQKSLLKRPVSESEEIFCGLFFEEAGEFIISQTIPATQWKKESNDIWRCEIQRLLVKDYDFFSGFHYNQKDAYVNKHRYQMAIRASQKGMNQGAALRIYVRSGQRPGDLIFSLTQKNPVNHASFMPFKANQFYMNGVKASFLMHDYNKNLPSIMLTFRNKNNALVHPAKQSMNVMAQTDAALFTPMTVNLTEQSRHIISNSFLNGLKGHLDRQFKKNKLAIQYIDYPPRSLPFTTELLFSPAITIEPNLTDNVQKDIQNIFTKNQWIQTLAVSCLEEDLLLNNLTFNMYVYQKDQTNPYTISESVQISPNTQDNILSAMEKAVQQFVTRVSNLPVTHQKITIQKAPVQKNNVQNGPNPYKTIYQMILDNGFYCTPDLTNEQKKEALIIIAQNINKSCQEVVQLMKNAGWDSTFTLKNDTNTYDIFSPISIREISTKHMTDPTIPDFSIYMQIFLSRYVSDLQTLKQSPQIKKRYKGLKPWRAPTIEELLYIFQLNDMQKNHSNPLKEGVLYHFWSASPTKNTNNNQSYFLLVVKKSKTTGLMLDIDIASTFNGATMLIVSKKK